MKVSAIIVAGGMGKRLGADVPKAFLPLGDKDIFLHSAEVFDKMGLFEEIIIVVPKVAVAETEKKVADFSTKVIVIEGGKERHNSVENGVKIASGQVVLIHDAARPFITEKLVSDLLNFYEEKKATNKISGVISANLVVDTIRKFDGEKCKETINRDELIAVATPQIFDKAILLNCFEKIDNLDKIPTDEAMLVQNFGFNVLWQVGSRKNFKITTTDDFELAERLVGG